MLDADPFYLYYYKDSLSTTAAATIAKTARWLTEKYHEYYRSDVTSPQYHIMEMPEYGDISSGNVTGISLASWQGFDPKQWPPYALAHELVHPYVFNGTPQNDPIYAFVREGFPSFFHYPVLGEMLGAEWLAERMRAIERGYLDRRASGLDRRGRTLPIEKPIAEMTPDDIGVYKDRFVLADRALLCLYWIYRRLGRDKFFDYCRDLFAIKGLTLTQFYDVTAAHLPNSRPILKQWLETADFTPEMRIRD